MIIKEAKYKKVRITRTKCVSDAVYGCDHCRKEIKDHPNENPRLEITVFYHDGRDSPRLHFCSWKCALRYRFVRKTMEIPEA